MSSPSRLSLARGYLRTQLATTAHKFWVARNLCVWVVDDVQRFWHENGPAGADDPMPLGQAFRVTNAALAFWATLLWRALVHDLSKYRWSEASAFARTIHDFKRTEYGTPAYDELLDRIRPAIKLHYGRNRHHPEHHDGGHGDGFRFMSRIDRIEMIADWGAAIRRQPGGSMERSFATNAERFGYGPADAVGLHDTARRMGLL